MKATTNIGFSMKEVINSESATQTMSDVAGKTLKVTGILIGEKVDNEGEKKTVAVMKTDAGLITTISPTVLNALDTIVNAYESAGALAELEQGITVIVNVKKSANKREFYTLEVVE